MSEVLNANPTVYDVSLLPSRDEKSDTVDENDILSIYKLSISDKPEMSKAKRLMNENSEKAKEELAQVSDLDSETDSDNGSESEIEEIDALEIYGLIANISDPEHPLSLAALGVVNLEDIEIRDLQAGNDGQKISQVVVKITPTINHCSLATLIGLGIRVRLERCLPPRYRILILLKEGSHQSETQVNKQLNDKERISAACENNQLLSVISTMLATC